MLIDRQIRERAREAWADGEVRRLRAVVVELLERVGGLGLPTAALAMPSKPQNAALRSNVLNESLWRLALEAEGELGLREAIDENSNRVRERSRVSRRGVPRLLLAERVHSLR